MRANLSQQHTQNNLSQYSLQHVTATLEQGVILLKQIPDQCYSLTLADNESSIGAHYRHILDHFLAVQKALHNGIVDYEQRRRLSAVETERQLAVTEYLQLQQWLISQPVTEWQAGVSVLTDIGVGQQFMVKVASSLGRELLFCCSHAVHHYHSILKIYAQLKPEAAAHYCLTSTEIGLAASTATYRRGIKSCVP